jgi:5-methylcytosine-specific restriction endonuclease McrBC GTP-binding regulatory subunit McrB
VSEAAPDLSTISYEDKKRAIEDFIFEKYDPEAAKKYVLIIDEINRGNVAQIFGELITLIEDDKRMGAKTTIKAILPYSNESFSVPPNVYFIGTMNTADRSVEALDTALRRRFSFIKMEPEPKELPYRAIGEIDLVKMLETINERLKVLIDADHTIGHAWLWDVKDLDGLKKVFEDKIIPLLQEFFYNDYEKIGLVLGPKFVIAEKKGNILARFNGGNGLGSQYQDRYLFKITSPDEWDSEAFISIYRTNGSNE